MASTTWLRSCHHSQSCSSPAKPISRVANRIKVGTSGNIAAVTRRTHALHTAIRRENNCSMLPRAMEFDGREQREGPAGPPGSPGIGSTCGLPPRRTAARRAVKAGIRTVAAGNRSCEPAKWSTWHGPLSLRGAERRSNPARIADGGSSGRRLLRRFAPCNDRICTLAENSGIGGLVLAGSVAPLVTEPRYFSPCSNALLDRCRGRGAIIRLAVRSAADRQGEKCHLSTGRALTALPAEQVPPAVVMRLTECDQARQPAARIPSTARSLSCSPHHGMPCSANWAAWPGAMASQRASGPDASSRRPSCPSDAISTRYA